MSNAYLFLSCFGFASSMKRIVCIYNFVTVAFFYIGVQLFPKLMIIKIVLIRIYIKKGLFHTI